LNQHFYLSWLLLHFYLIVAVSSHDVLSNLARGLTWLPPSFEKHWQTGERLSGDAVGASLTDSNPFRAVTSFYLYSAGIESGYGFFAPNVPNSSKLVFELHYDDGHVEYELPHVNDTAAGLRLISLLNYIGETDYDPLREVILKMLAYSIWEAHPDATTIRTVYGYVSEPALSEAKRGTRESYHFLYAYEFSFRSKPAPSPAP
jgi:hypothetical protein